MKSLRFLVLLLSIFLITENVNAGWKFWKSKDKSITTTETPSNLNSQLNVTLTSTTAAAPTTKATPTTKAKGPTPKTPVSINKALAGVADPGLVVGVGNTGGNIKNNARPQTINPGTEVGQNLPNSKSKPDTSGYRDWAIDLTGANEGRQPPKLPNQGPALFPGPQTRPEAQTPKSASSVSPPKPAILASTSRPGISVSTPKAGTSGSALKPITSFSTPKPATSASTPKPAISGVGHQEYPSLPSKPGSVGAPSSGKQSPTGGKTFAQAASGGSKPGSPTLAPKFGVPALGGSQPIKIDQLPERNQPSPQSGTPTAGITPNKAEPAPEQVNQKFANDPKYSKGNTITDEDLRTLSEHLFSLDVNNAMKHISLNLQKQVSGDNFVDEAPERLLTVNPEALKIGTIQKVMALYDNYNLDTRVKEYRGNVQREEENLLVNTFLSTTVMSKAMNFLSLKALVRKDYYDYKDLLRKLWFTFFSRGEGIIGSNGFEHVFMTELKMGREVSGLHNWIYFNDEESKRLDYMGYLTKVDLGNKASILKVRSKFNDLVKPVTTLFVGTSPELEMALYTVCFLARPDQACPVSLGGTNFNIKTYKFRYTGKDVISSAYPDI